jgi:hypothetical protein
MLKYQLKMNQSGWCRDSMFDTTMKICIGIGLEDNGTGYPIVQVLILKRPKHGDDPWINNADYTISKGKVF